MKEITRLFLIDLFIACISFWAGSIYMDTIWRSRLPAEFQFCIIETSPALAQSITIVIGIALIGIGFFYRGLVDQVIEK